MENAFLSKDGKSACANLKYYLKSYINLVQYIRGAIDKFAELLYY